MATKQVTATTIVNAVVTNAAEALKVRNAGYSISQQIAALYKANGIKSRDADGYKAFRKNMRDKLAAKLEGADDDLKQLASRTLDAQLSYGMNIVTGHNRAGDKTDANGRVIKAKARGTKAAKRDTPAEKEVPQVKHVVTRDAALAFMSAALGGNQAENEFALAYLIDTPAMRDKLIQMVKFSFEAAALKKAA